LVEVIMYPRYHYDYPVTTWRPFGDDGCPEGQTMTPVGCQPIPGGVEDPCPSGQAMTPTGCQPIPGGVEDNSKAKLPTWAPYAIGAGVIVATTLLVVAVTRQRV
jgi:hypothetical protein